MTEQRTYQGATYERSGPGQPWALVGGGEPASGASTSGAFVPRTPPPQTGPQALHDVHTAQTAGLPTGFEWDSSGHGAHPIRGTPMDPLYGQNALDPTSITDAERRVAQAMITGRVAPPTGRNLATPQTMRLLAVASSIDPEFDMTTWGRRHAASIAYGSGPQSRNITSFNTAIHHIDRYARGADALDNWGGETTPAALSHVSNSLRNAMANGNLAGRLVTFNNNANAVADELTTAFRGTNGAEADVRAWRASLSPNMTPQEFHASVQSALELLRGRIESMQSSYRQAMGPNATIEDLIDPHSRDIMHSLENGTLGTPPSATPGASQPGAVSPAAPSDPNAPPGTPPPDGEGLVVDVWPGGPPPHDRSQANAAWQNAFQRASTREPGLTWDAFIARNLAPIGQQTPPGQALVTTPPRQGLFGPTSPSLDNSYLGQGLSGINEGIANTLGAPVDLVNSLYGAGLHGINAIANTDFQPSGEPLLGSGQFRRLFGLTGSIAPPTDNPGQQFVRRTAQSVGGALIPVAGTAGNMARAGTGMLTALGGGMGAATAQQVAPGNPYVELGGEVLGSLGSAGGMFGLARRAARQAAEAAVPTVPQLRQQAGNLYTAAESRGIVAGPSVTRNIASRIRTIARDEELVTPTGRVSTAYPRAAEAMNLMNDYGGAHMTPRQIQVIRETLGDAVGGTQGKERRIASMMLHAFDEETVPLAPELAQARDIASRYLQANQVQRAIDLAEPRAAQYSQSGSQNALRTEFRNLDRRMINGQAQFTPAVAAAIERVSRGDVSTNIMRNVGRLAPTGTVSTGLSAGVPFLIGNAMGGPAVGAAASAGTMALGTAARAGANRATVNQARMAEMLARNGGEINSVDPDVAYRIAMALMSPALAASHPPY